MNISCPTRSYSEQHTRLRALAFRICRECDIELNNVADMYWWKRQWAKLKSVVFAMLRVESFIEHQDTCRAVKNKNNMQEGGSDRKRNRRNLSESPSQSSDTTQAITLAHSGISDTTARSLDSSRLINEPTTEFNTNPVALMPLWLVERRNELQLLPWKRQSPEISYSEAFQASGTMHDIRREVSGARSQVTRCSSISSPCPEVSFSDSKSLPPSLTSDDANTPSLQLSIGPYSTEVASENDPGPCEIDTKPSLSSAEREAVVITYEQRQPRGGEASVTGSGQRGYSGRGLGKDLALSFPGVHGAQPAVDVSGEGKSSLSLNDFLLQAARRLGPPKNETRPSSSQFSQPEQPMSTHVEMASNVTLVGSTSKSHAGERERGHDSGTITSHLPSGVVSDVLNVMLTTLIVRERIRRKNIQVRNLERL